MRHCRATGRSVANKNERVTLDFDRRSAWDAEIRTRIAEFERGDLELIPADDVFARARKLAD